ncbi:hypothetical protein P4234_25820 [Pseudomonas aeruginosa]|nr:hypothetical protein [Pseudomonas aeruginosa]
MIGNTVTLVVLPSRTPLDATSIRIGLDIDSFAWSFSADLFGRTSLDLAAPDANGPRTVELEINGWTWRFLVERYSGSGKHPSERYTISGASRTQLLDAPYAPKRSAVNTAPLNARQVVDDQLQYTGFSVSWDVENMGPPDWTLPAGAFSYQDQTPMQVIVKLAEVAGGIVRPGLMDDSVTILPRYREATWYWDTAIPDRIIPAAIVAEWGSEWSPQPAWNFVYVSGTSYGVSVQVRRAGTAGEESAPDVMEDWMTGTEVARSRGICELSKGGNQAIETRRIPLFQKDDGVPGLVQPGMLVEVRDEQATWRGLCLATDISAEGVGASRVWQTLRIERHYPEAPDGDGQPLASVHRALTGRRAHGGGGDRRRRGRRHLPRPPAKQRRDRGPGHGGAGRADGVHQRWPGDRAGAAAPPVRYRGLTEPSRPACRPGTAGGRTRVSR